MAQLAVFIHEIVIKLGPWHWNSRTKLRKHSLLYFVQANKILECTKIKWNQVETNSNRIFIIWEGRIDSHIVFVVEMPDFSFYYLITINKFVLFSKNWLKWIVKPFDISTNDHEFIVDWNWPVVSPCFWQCSKLMPTILLKYRDFSGDFFVRVKAPNNISCFQCGCGRILANTPE